MSRLSSAIPDCRTIRSSPATRPLSSLPAIPVKRLSGAIAGFCAVLVELTNYKKDGRPFRNAVMIAPLFDAAGEVTYFRGSQMEIDDSAAHRQASACARIAALSRRQLQILEALAKGRLNKQIAYELDLTERTIKMHRAAMLRALGVRTVAEAIRIAIEAGL